MNQPNNACCQVTRSPSLAYPIFQRSRKNNSVKRFLDTLVTNLSVSSYALSIMRQLIVCVYMYMYLLSPRYLSDLSEMKRQTNRIQAAHDWFVLLLYNRICIRKNTDTYQQTMKGLSVFFSFIITYRTYDALFTQNGTFIFIDVFRRSSKISENKIK